MDQDRFFVDCFVENVTLFGVAARSSSKDSPQMLSLDRGKRTVEESTDGGPRRIRYTYVLLRVSLLSSELTICSLTI